MRVTPTDMVEYLTDEYPEVGVRFNTGPLPWQGTLIDPDMDYETGEAVFLVEESDVPNHMRQAALSLRWEALYANGT